MFGKNVTDERKDIPQKNYKVDKQTAELDFMQFCEDWDIDTDIDDLDQDRVLEYDDDGNPIDFGKPEESEKDEFNQLKKQIIRKVMSGNAVYSPDTEEWTYTTLKPVRDGHGKGGDSKTFPVKRGTESSWWGIATSGKKQDNMKLKDKKIAAMIGMPLDFVGRIDDVDMKFLNAVLSLFSNS